MDKKLYVVERCPKCPNYRLNRNNGITNYSCYALINEGTIKVLSKEFLDAQKDTRGRNGIGSY